MVLLWLVGRASAATLVVHGQNRFEGQAALFYGDPVPRWLKTSTGCEVKGGLFASPDALLETLRSTPGPLVVYLSTHMTGQGPDSRLWVGQASLSASHLLQVLEDRQQPFALTLDTCFTGFAPPVLQYGGLQMAAEGEDVENDRTGSAPLGEVFLVDHGAPPWGAASASVQTTVQTSGDLCRLRLLPPPGAFHAAGKPATRAPAQAICAAKGQRLCGYADWRSQPLGALGEICGGSAAPEWLADDTGDGRALLWLGCGNRADGRRFGARLPTVVSPEIGFRCCPAD